MPTGNRAFRLLEIVTVGFPFCAFKALTGAVLLSFGGWRVLGWALIGVAGVDVVLNTAALAFTLAGRASRWPVCTAQWLVARLGAGRRGWWQLGLSIDAMFAFTLVALVIGGGWLDHLSDRARMAWSLGVVLNVLGAGLGRLAESLLELEPERG